MDGLSFRPALAFLSSEIIETRGSVAITVTGSPTTLALMDFARRSVFVEMGCIVITPTNLIRENASPKSIASSVLS